MNGATLNGALGTTPGGLSSVARGLFAILIATAVFVPFVRLAGPLSGDDLFPLLAVMVALAAAPFEKRQVVFDITVFGFLALLVVSLVSSSANAVSLPDFVRLAGRSAGRAGFYLAVVVCVRLLLDDPRWLRFALIAFVAAATVQAVFCIYAVRINYQGPFAYGVADIPAWSVLKGHRRAHGTFSGELAATETVQNSANFLAAYCLLTLPATAGLLAYVKRPWLRFVVASSTLLQLITLYLTYTRAALLALAAAGLVVGWVLGKRRLAIGAVLLGATLTLAIPTMRNKFFKEGHDRYALWWATKEAVLDHPWTGVGDGNYVPLMRKTPRYHETPYGVAGSSPHNSILLSAASHGLLGGLAHLLLDAFVVLTCLIWLRRSRGRGRWLVGGVVMGVFAFMVQDQFNNLSYVPKVATQYWFCFALVPLLARQFASADLRGSTWYAAERLKQA